MIDLRFNKVSKRYRVRQELEKEPDGHPILRKIQSLRRPAIDFWALKNVSFEVERGEVLGVIGHNGAGKSTILKLLANITSPTRGEITINGRLAALIEVGSGFHPELTGRENIYLNGSILGMRRREIAKKLDVPLENAHQLKVLNGLNAGPRQTKIVGALEPSLKRIATEIRKVIRYYSERLNENYKLEQVLIVGGGSNVPGIGDFFTNELFMPARVASPWQKLDFGKLAQPNKQFRPRYISVAGLASINRRDIWK